MNMLSLLFAISVLTAMAQEPVLVHVAQTPVQSVPAGAQGIEVLHLSLTAPCSSDISILGLGIQKRGMGSRNDIESILVRENGIRRSRSRPINRKDGVVDIPIRRFTIDACETKSLSVEIDLTDTASLSAEHIFFLKDIQTDLLPVRIISISNSPVRPIRTSGPTQGNIVVTYPTRSRRRVSYGSRRRIGTVRLQNSSRYNQSITSLILTNTGTARSTHLQNIYLAVRRNRPVTAKISSLTGDSAKLVFSKPFELRKNRSVNFDIIADVRASRSKTIRMIIEEPSDIATSNSSLRQ